MYHLHNLTKCSPSAIVKVYRWRLAIIMQITLPSRPPLPDMLENNAGHPFRHDLTKLPTNIFVVIANTIADTYIG